MEMDDAPFRSIPLEMWNAILHFLDYPSLAKAQGVCKDFYYLSVREEHWKKEATFLFSSNIVPYYQEKYSSLGSWKQLIKDVQQHDLTGSWEIYIRLDDHFDVFTVFGHWELANNSSRLCSKILRGSGNAPWGPFSTVGCNMGPFYTLLHTYNEGEYYSSYIGTIDEDAKTKVKLLYGPYKTNWEDLTGTFVAINTSYTLDRKQLIEILRDRFNRVDNTRDQAYEILLSKFAGKVFEVSFVADEACLKPEDMHRDFKLTFKMVYNTNRKGLKGFILTTDRGFVPMPLIKSSLVLATLSQNMIQMSFIVWKAQHSFTTVTCICNFKIAERQIESSSKRNGIAMEAIDSIMLGGSYVWSNSTSPLNFGKVIGQSIDPKSATNKIK